MTDDIHPDPAVGAGRRSALADYQVLDTPPEPAFDDLAKLAATVCEAPIALIGLLDADRMWFKSRVGFDRDEIGLDQSPCAIAVRQGGLIVVPDAATDPRLAATALVAGPARIRFYAGTPLTTPGGVVVGTLCVMDRSPRTLTPAQAGALAVLGRQVVALLELRHHVAKLEVARAETSRAEATRATSDARQVAVLEVAPDAIVAIDHRGTIVEFNPAAERTFGYDRAEAIGQPMADLIVPPKYRAAHRAGLERYRQAGEAHVIGKRIEITAMRRDGTVFPIELAVAVIRREGPPTFVACLRDITERKRAEAALQAMNGELESRVRERTAELAEAYDATIEGWARALDLRDRETEGHSRRVTEMTIRLAAELGVGGDDLVQIRRGALLHDIGKLGIPDAVLLKPGRLTDQEWDVMRRHPGYAHEWLASVRFLRPALDIPHCHHERWDGSGYPRGLAGEAIPLAARIFAAVDIWDALRSDRPYRAGWPEDRVRDHLRSLAGSHLDPTVVDTFLRLLDQEGGPGDLGPGRDGRLPPHAGPAASREFQRAALIDGYLARLY